MIERMQRERRGAGGVGLNQSQGDVESFIADILGNGLPQRGPDLSSEPQAVTQDSERGRYAVYSTGRSRHGITSQELAKDGSWDTQDWLTHHSDRSQSWAAGNIRNEKNQDLDAYDFTFERVDAQGKGIGGSAQGLPLIAPWDAKVIDIHHEYQGSGGYGRFIALEDLITGMRFEVHHLDSVAALSKGQTIKGGTEIGTQGASGSGRYDFATHVDIVGTPESVEAFVRANQTGTFKTTERPGGA